MTKIPFLIILALVSLTSIIFTGCSGTGNVTLNVSAAASMTDALKEVNSLYMQQSGHVAILANFASSGTLETQIENGAPADVFISAAEKQMNLLEDKDLIVKDTRQNLLTNQVVLIVPDDSTLNIDSFMDLTDRRVARIGIGDPEFVPAGTYGKQALELLGIYTEVQPKLILAGDVRQVLSYVENGNVDAGIVYSTDAAISNNVKIAAVGPGEINDKIVYPVAVVKASANVDKAGSYIDFLFGSDAKQIFEQYGFSMAGQ